MYLKLIPKLVFAALLILAVFPVFLRLAQLPRKELFRYLSVPGFPALNPATAPVS